MSREVCGICWCPYDEMEARCPRDEALLRQAMDALNHVNVQDRVQIIAALRERLGLSKWG